MSCEVSVCFDAIKMKPDASGHTRVLADWDSDRSA